VIDDRLTGWLILDAAALPTAAWGARAQPADDAPLPPHFSYFAPSAGWFVETEADIVRPRIGGLRSGDPSTFLFDPSAHAMDPD
jgi:hypothetical protein